MEHIFGNETIAEENDWISFSDLMAVMMVIFLFIAIIYFDRVPKNTQQIIAQKVQLEKDLQKLEQDTALLNQRKEVLEAERIEIENDLKEAIALKEELSQEAKELKQTAAIAEASKIEAQEAAEDAKKATIKAESAKAKFKATLDDFKNIELEIYQALLSEFENDLRVWNAELIKDDLIFRFKSPEVLFPPGESKLTSKFQKILSSFVPRYVTVLRGFSDFVEEVRVEGHTSSEYTNEATALGKYIANMSLSQNRTRSVTEYSLLAINGNDRQWLQKNLTANGLSSSKLIYNASNEEDRKSSRRVEFTVRTAIRKTLMQLEKLNN